MNYTIDLKELAYRESEQVEWKENVADINDVIQTAVAFSNRT
jgi:ATP-dependent DNA helicase RecG